jgi:hypothetical protein
MDAFSDAIGDYVSDRSLRRKRRETGRDLVDGRGVDRVLRKVLSAGDSNRNA